MTQKYGTGVTAVEQKANRSIAS